MPTPLISNSYHKKSVYCVKWAPLLKSGPIKPDSDPDQDQDIEERASEHGDGDDGTRAAPATQEDDGDVDRKTATAKKSCSKETFCLLSCGDGMILVHPGGFGKKTAADFDALYGGGHLPGTLWSADWAMDIKITKFFASLVCDYGRSMLFSTPSIPLSESMDLHFYNFNG